MSFHESSVGIFEGGLLNVGGTLTSSDTSSIKVFDGGRLLSYGTFNNSQNSTVDVFSGGRLDIRGALNNFESSSIAIAIGGQMINSGTINNLGILNNSGSLIHNGSIDNSVGTLHNSGTISGSGQITGLLTDTGSTAPGVTSGVLTFDNWDKTGGSLDIDLGGTFSGDGDKSLTEFDWIDVSGTANLGGTLNLQLISGFELDDLYSFTIINVQGLLNGTFDGLQEGALVENFGDFDMFITYIGGDGNDVTLYSSQVAVPTPSSAMLLLSVSAILGVARRRKLRA